ncbi:transporter substrate-binding domain-containing protein [Candidatus Dependentiae bacterium]|nr:transporter substrate-binding domain-containing protein [Candidatus Dependentiae bacterium]MBU4387355.1 transporter substrate-binding domain-containing protein [Candidatus Dependentiae bacterium]MCG2756076.1 transporter substrate-binding domain-containing protein [Candidatus Dependentiae bacterium]
MVKKIILISTIILLFSSYYFFNKNTNKINDEILIIGTNAEYQPFSFVKNNKISGFDISLIKKICKNLSKKFELKDLPFDVLIPEIQRNSIDIIAAGMTPTKERENVLCFSKCYFAGDPLVIVSNKNNPFKTVDELTDKNVIVNDGYTADFYVSSISNINVIRLSNPASAFLALESGKAQAYVAAKSTVTPYLKQYDKNFILNIIPNTEEKYALAISRKNKNLIPQINSCIDQMEKDGTLTKLKEKWGLA